MEMGEWEGIDMAADGIESRRSPCTRMSWSLFKISLVPVRLKARIPPLRMVPRTAVSSPLRTMPRRISRRRPRMCCRSTDELRGRSLI